MAKKENLRGAKVKFCLSTLGGIGDTLMLSMPAKRLKELYPNSEVHAFSRSDTYSVLGSSKYIDKIGKRKGWSNLPILEGSKYDMVIDVRYMTKTFWLNNKIELDIPKKEIKKRQRKYELDLYVNDMDFYRMPHWQKFLEKSKFKKEGYNWCDMISYFTGLNFDASYMNIHTEESVGLPKDYIAVSSPTILRGISKLYLPQYWNEVFRAFPKEKFVLLGQTVNKQLKGKNVYHREGKYNIFQTADVIKRSKVLITEEGGLAHVANAVGKKAVVLFGATQKWFFGYKQNINLEQEIKECKFCHNKKIFWMKKCDINKTSPYCKKMEELKPEKVINAVKKVI